MAVLDVAGLHAGYERDLDILQGVSLAAAAGRITALLGANGVGKSTLLKVVAGFLRPSRGQVSLDGRSLVGVPPHQMVSRGVSYIPQQPGIFSEMTVEENLLIGGWSFRRDRARVRRQLEAGYRRFPVLAEKRRQRAGQLSGGQQRMVEIARALMADPALVLVDEPTASLAPMVWQEVYRAIVDLRDQGRAVLLVDQEIRQALRIADYVYVLDLGRNRRQGVPADFADLERSFWL